MVIVPAGCGLLPEILRLLATDPSTRLGDTIERLDDPERAGAYVLDFYLREMVPLLASGGLACSGIVVERGGDDPPLHEIAPVPPAAWRSAKNADEALREPRPGLAALFGPGHLQFPAGVVSHGTAAFLPLFRLEEIRKWAALPPAPEINTWLLSWAGEFKMAHGRPPGRKAAAEAGKTKGFSERAVFRAYKALPDELKDHSRRQKPAP